MLAPALKKPKLQTLQTAHIPAPIGGMNTVSGGTAMGPEYSIHSWNLTPSEYGLRSRLGYREWVTGLTGAGGNNGVRSILGFTGSQMNGSANRLFGCTRAGIWNGSAATASPTQMVTFGTHTGDAGWGTSCVVSTPGGRFLVYTDEENGLYVYSEVSTTWAQVLLGTTQLWDSDTTYTLGNKVVNDGNVYVATVPGVSASSGGPTGTGTDIADGTAEWDYVAAAASSRIGPSLADQQAGLTGDPASFVFCMVWKSRLFLIERNTSRAWYLDVNSLFGTATSFDFGPQMRAGGQLIALYNWSYDGGSGMDTLLVGLSQGGDAVIYQGTDPDSAETFGLKGVWSVAGLPYGRRVATDRGGELLIASVMGPLPLSELVVGGAIQEGSQYATKNIANLFTQLISAYRSLPGWSLTIHPTDNALLVTVPTTADQNTTQLAMSFSTKGWGRYRDLPMLSAGVWNGTLYFGTADGRICVNEGYVDNVKLANPDISTPVEYSLLTSYQNLGNARIKKVQMVRPTILSETPNPTVEVTPRYNFDLTEPPPVAASGTGPAHGTWGSAVWDDGDWLGELVSTQPFFGSAGMGRDVALAIRGSATSRTTIVGIDVFFEQGGLL